jgi:RHS repeat-associated protein
VRHTEYAPFGRIAGQVVAGDTVSPWLYAGHRFEFWSGFSYMQARWYSQATGTFVSIDPVVADALDPQAYNAYAYVRNNPISHTDPTGASIETALEEALSFFDFLSALQAAEGSGGEGGGGGGWEGAPNHADRYNLWSPDSPTAWFQETASTRRSRNRRRRRAPGMKTARPKECSILMPWSPRRESPSGMRSARQKEPETLGLQR